MHFFLCDFLLDISQNSMEAGATEIKIFIVETSSYISFKVVDNGKGMSDEVLKKVKDPFYTDGVKHSKRKVGLGIPFIFQTSKDCKISSSLGKGTTIEFGFDLTDIDVMPLGNLSLTILALFSGNYTTVCDVIVERSLTTEKGFRSYKISRFELLDVLKDLRSSGSLSLAKQFLESKEEEINQVRVETMLDIPDKGELL